MRNQKKPPRKKAIKRGIYLDFEGFQDKPPAMVGVLCEGHFEQVIFSEELHPAAHAKGLCVSTLERELKDLIDRANRQKRWIFAYTRHELNELEEWCPGLLPRMRQRYHDVHKFTKKWLNKFYHDEKPGDLSLQSLVDYIGHPYPKHLGTGQATSRLRSVINMLKRKGNYADLTGTVKAKWTKLLDYNERDCRSMKKLALHVKQDYIDRR